MTEEKKIQKRRIKNFNKLSAKEMTSLISQHKAVDIAEMFKISLSSVYRLVDKKVSRDMLRTLDRPPIECYVEKKPLSADENDYGFGAWMNSKERVVRETIKNEMEYINPLKDLSYEEL
jgi:hypothetical protein